MVDDGDEVGGEGRDNCFFNSNGKWESLVRVTFVSDFLV